MSNKIFSLIFFLIISPVLFSQSKFDPYHYTITKNVTSKNGAVVSAHTLASEVGVSILMKGGNAMDAAIATQLTLAVVYPGAGNIGGGGFTVAHFKDGKNIAIDYRERAPGKASRDMYLDANGNPLTELSLNGHLSSGVPGSVAGIFMCVKYAKLPFRVLIQPAIDLAEKGFAITESQARSFNATKDEFIKMNTTTPVFVKNDKWKVGDTLVQKDLASTLKRIRDLGKKGFYEGETAKLIVAEMKRGNGIISENDLKNYKAISRNPVTFGYKGYKIITMPLPGSGIVLEQMMKMAERKNISELKFETAQSVQLMTEIERRAYADRAKFLGDVDFVKVPVKSLVSDKYLSERMKDYRPGKAGSSKDIGAGNINPESEETTHFSVIDKDGNAVAVTTTLNNTYGSKTMVTGAGFLLNDEMDDFSVKQGVPNLYGAVGADANAITPGKRMLSSMTPTIVLKGKEVYLVVGTPGGTTITTSIFQTLMDILEFNLSAEDAVNKPKFHHQWLPDQIDLEKDFPEDVKKQLTKMGYVLKERSSIGRTELIKFLGKKIVAVADKRGDDDARGYIP